MRWPRYQTTNDRGFRACLNDLLKLRCEQRKSNRSAQGVRGPLCANQEGFESQNREAELHDARVRLANARAAHLELDTDIRSYVDAPIPGYSSIPLEQVKELLQSAILSLKPSKGAKTAA